MRERNRSPPSVALLGFFFADLFFFFLLANLGIFVREPSKREGDRVLERESLGLR